MSIGPREARKKYILPGVPESRGSSRSSWGPREARKRYIFYPGSHRCEEVVEVHDDMDEGVGETAEGPVTASKETQTSKWRFM